MKDLEGIFVDDNKMMELVLNNFKIGWWKLDFEKQIYTLSDNIRIQLGLESPIVPFDMYLELIRPDFRERVVKNLTNRYELNGYDIIVPLNLGNKEVWIHIKSIELGYLNNEDIGSIQILSDWDENSEKDSARLRANNLLEQLNAISHTLLSFLQTDNRDLIVDNILKDILNLFKAGRAYIIEYDWDKRTQTCTYEVVDDGITGEQELLENLSIDANIWWTERIKSGRSIVLSTLDDLPPEAGPEREILAVQEIKSLFVTPLFSRDGVWAYAGIDIVAEQHNWSLEDIRWLTSLFNIISICIELQRSEKNVEEERDYFQELCEHMPIGYMSLKPIYDEDNNLVDYMMTDLNHAAEKIIGYSKNLLIGGTGSSMYPNYKEYLSEFDKILKSKTHTESTRFLENTGKYCNAIVYSTGANRLTSLLSDVTELFKTNQILDQKEKILRNIFDNLPAGIELYDNKGNLTDFNKKNAEMFGMGAKEDVNINIFEEPNMLDEYKERLRNKEPISFHLSYSFDKINGKFYECLRSGKIDIYMIATMLYDAQGEFINYLFINIDKTELNEAYSKIIEFERSFSLVSECGKIGYCKFDLHSRIGYAGEQWYQNLGEIEGVPLNEIIGHYNTLHEKDRLMLINYLHQIEQNEIDHFNVDLRIITPEGVKWIRTNVIRDMNNEDAGKLEIISITYDITELKETEHNLTKAKDKAEVSDRLKSAFLANMSHEIRTPLNAIVGFSELLSESDDQKEKDEYMKIVHNNNNLLIQLISDILDLSKIEAGVLDVSYTKIAANQLCNEVITSFPTGKNHKVRIVFEEPTTDCDFISDVNRLKQVISNFISNALKFTSVGQITLGYNLVDKQKIKFYVQDSGCGIAPEKLENIFERFVKLDTFAQGTGLGLSICKSIIDQFGGEIGVDSEVGKGTCFWFILPRKLVSIL